MNKISVEYLNHMGDDMMIANVARVSFNKWKDGVADEGDKRLIKYLAEHEHTSPFRHNAITIRCEAPIWLARQLGKHQVGMSWNEVSRRYVDTDIEFFLPEYRSRPEGGIKQGSGGCHPEASRWLAETIDLHDAAFALYDAMVEDGVAPEQARGVLPQNMMTTWIWTGSLMAFSHLFKLRVDGHAQVEAQIFAKEVDRVMSELFPVSWEHLKSE